MNREAVCVTEWRRANRGLNYQIEGKKDVVHTPGNERVRMQDRTHKREDGGLRKYQECSRASNNEAEVEDLADH